MHCTLSFPSHAPRDLLASLFLLHGLRPPIPERLGWSGLSTQNSPTPPLDSQDMRLAPRLSNTDLGTPRSPNHMLLGLNLCTQMLSLHASPLRTPWSASQHLSILQDLTQPCSSLLAFGMLQILPKHGHFLDTPKILRPQLPQTSPNL